MNSEATYDLSGMSRSELEGWIVHLAKIIDDCRNKLGPVVISLEDEGDRVYFGSTNDADWLREIEAEMTDSLNELEMPWMNGKDLFAELATLRARLEVAERDNARLREPQWFYAEGWEEQCLFSPGDAIDYCDPAENCVIEVACARPLPSIWCAVQVCGDNECDERITFTEHASEADAQAALAQQENET